MPVIKIFGLPRTCTNLTQVSLQQNFHIRICKNQPCWKHGYYWTKNGRVLTEPPQLATTDLRFIVCTKHPVTWANSLLYRELEHHHKRISSKIFLRKLPTDYIQASEQQDSPNYKGNTPINLWNKLNHHWLTLYDDPTVLQHVKHEDWCSDPIAVLTQLREAFGLEMKIARLTPITQRIGSNLKYRGPFMPRKNKLSAGDLKTIQQQVNPDVMKMTGYSIWSKNSISC